MADAELDTTLRAWGNSYGILIPADVARRLHAKPGTRLHVKVTHDPAHNDAADLPTYTLGYVPDINAILDEELGDH